MTQITINLDQSLSVCWQGRKGRGSLFQIMAEGNAKDVNLLSREEMAAVVMAVKHMPFPLGNGPKFYADVLTKVREHGANQILDEKFSDGEIRKYLVIKAGEGCNAPWDTYISIAAKPHKEEKTNALCE